MAAPEDSSIAAGIDSVLRRLRELEVVLGPQVRPALAQVQAALIEAAAARERGDAQAAAERISDSMDRLSSLGEQLGPAEAVLMRALVRTFRSAMQRGDQAAARRLAGVMRARSGAKPVNKDGE